MDYFELTPYFDYIAGMELDGGRGSKAEVIEYALDVCKMKRQDKGIDGWRSQARCGRRAPGLGLTVWVCCTDLEALRN